MTDLVHGEDYFHFGDKVTQRYKRGSSESGSEEFIDHYVVIGAGERVTSDQDLLRCAHKSGAVLLIHPRLLDMGWL